MSTTTTVKGRTILVSDDEQWYVEPLKEALECEGYTVVQARTGSETLEHVQRESHRPDLVILDVMMNPGTLGGAHAGGTRTGLILAHAIRDDLKLNENTLPIICLTVLQEDDLQRQMSRLGIQFFCKGEVELKEILAAVCAKLSPSIQRG